MRNGEVLHLWVLALLGLIDVGVDLWPQRQDFFQKVELSHLVVDEILGTWGQSFVFTPVNLATVPQVLLFMGP